jgi:transcriptional regulator with XRE-family HTH domain
MNQNDETSLNDFAGRLTQACDEHEHVPPLYKGRQIWLSRELGVSPEAARKWLEGLARPRTQKMKELAQKLGVDESWLALGSASDVPLKERRARNAVADGAVNVVAGYIQMNGGNPAFPSGDDSNTHIDLYAIIKGEHLSIHVALGVEDSDSSITFMVPAKECTVIGVVPVYQLRSVFLYLPHSTITKHGERVANYYRIAFTKENGDYYLGGKKWPRLQSFSSLSVR